MTFSILGIGRRRKVFGSASTVQNATEAKRAYGDSWKTTLQSYLDLIAEVASNGNKEYGDGYILHKEQVEPVVMALKERGFEVEMRTDQAFTIRW